MYRPFPLVALFVLVASIWYSPAFATENAASIVPFTIATNGSPIVPVKLNDTTTAYFVLDNRSAECSISDRLVTALKMKRQTFQQKSGTPFKNFGGTPYELVYIDHFQCGSIPLRDMHTDVVSNDYLADFAGIRLGDEVVGLNRKLTADLSERQLFPELMKPPGTEIVVQFRHKGEEKVNEVRIKTSRLVPR